MFTMDILMPKIDYQYGHFRYFFNYYDSVGFHPFLIIIGENGKFPRSRLLGTYTILGFC